MRRTRRGRTSSDADEMDVRLQSSSLVAESNRRAAEWVRENLAQLLPNPPQITAGEVVAHA
jgi:hypothetical protein